MFFVYAIYNKKYKKVYIGQTTNLEVRLSQHNTKHFDKSYTSRFDGVWGLIYKEQFDKRVKVLEREKQLKSYQGRNFIKQFIP